MHRPRIFRTRRAGGDRSACPGVMVEPVPAAPRVSGTTRVFAATLAFTVAGIQPPALSGEPIYHGAPDWVSSDRPVSTGAALVDLNLDGWLDLVISNGNDIQREPLTAYYNLGDGTFPARPDWKSDDIGYHGHLDIADVNGDGYPDVAVSKLLNEGGPAAKLYLNNGGALSKKADWKSDEKVRAFAVAFGDVNGDGRPDLAVATGWPYDPGFESPSFVHLNVDGALEEAASWRSDDENDYLGALWVDADDDGWLDLLGVGADNASYVYRNLGGALETTANWQTTDNDKQFGIMAAAGDVTGDGVRDLFITDNTQLFDGEGYFRQYTGLADGYFATEPTWKYYDGYGSAVAVGDLDGDGRLDLATGAWFDKTRVFLNAGDGLPKNPTWSSSGTSVVEKIVLGDVNRDAVYERTDCFDPRDGDARLYHLAPQPIESVVSVEVDGDSLGPDEYAFSREGGWVSAGRAVQERCCVTYAVSEKLDLVVSNWDTTKGNYLWYNQRIIPADANCDAAVDFDDIDPFVLMLTDPEEFRRQHPGCTGENNCDMNRDGVVDFADIDGFVEALIG